MKIWSNKKSRINLILFTLNITYIFFIGIFADYKNIQSIYYSVISFIYLFSTLAIKRNSGKHIYLPVSIIILLWVSFILKMPILMKITSLLSTVFFIAVVFMLVAQVANSKKIGFLEFLESVNIYLLFGIAASILFKTVYNADPSAFTSNSGELSNRADFIYFSFVTLTTLGYGDILPVSNLAKSLTIFFTVTGQLYLTMIIALLVGKYLGSKNNN